MAARRIVGNGIRIEYGDNRCDAETVMDRDWTAYTKGLLRAEMAKRQVTYKGLVERLATVGISETEANLRNKISRGGFTAAFLMQCLAALEVQTLRLGD